MVHFEKITFFYFQESFRPSLSPTGDVFDDRKIDITSAIVSGFKTEQLTDQAENNSAEESSQRETSGGEKEKMDLEPTEATENPLQSEPTKSPEDDNQDENPDQSESSSATTVEVKGKAFTV